MSRQRFASVHGLGAGIVIAGETVAPVARGAFDEWYRAYGKRVVDVVAASALLLVFSPALIGAWLAVTLTSPGKAVFQQKRVGLGGHLFLMYKFRSMYIDQESRVDIAAIEENNKKGILFKPEDDPRVTEVGNFIRSTSIDEFPQLFNVLRGSMSLVGPRPLVPHMLAPFPDIMRKRSQVKPGITGLWQVSARSRNDSVHEMDAYDLQYVSDYSFWMDVKILLRTPFKMTDGAH
jgi:lipopolysaccharide/colanic/teichoic acid biosynthesis glycosyltransferase